jgi:transcriptional regulator with XRE-family HTH domain
MTKNPLLEKFRSQLSAEDKADMEATFAMANRIHDLLKKHGMTQRELAKRLNKGENEISKWLSGSHNFTLSTLNRISFAIGEPLYSLGTPVRTFAKRDLHMLITCISRIIKVNINTAERPEFKAYPERELSELKVTSTGIFHGKETPREFTEATLSPGSLKGIEKFTST